MCPSAHTLVMCKGKGRAAGRKQERKHFCYFTKACNAVVESHFLPFFGGGDDYGVVDKKCRPGVDASPAKLPPLKACKLFNQKIVNWPIYVQICQ